LSGGDEDDGRDELGSKVESNNAAEKKSCRDIRLQECQAGGVCTREIEDWPQERDLKSWSNPSLPLKASAATHSSARGNLATLPLTLHRAGTYSWLALDWSIR
jgi:hypothetical protein